MAALETSRVKVPCGPGADMDAYFTRPAGPVIASLVVIQEIFGVTAAMRDIADDFAGAGFACVVPDMFWRLERNVELGNGEDQPKRQKAIDLMGRFDLDQGVKDCAAAADWLRAKKLGSGKVGVVGFCIGGRVTGLMGARSRVDAICSFYGVRLDQHLSELAAITIPAQFHIGEADDQIPPPTVKAIRDALAQAGRTQASVFTYPGAGHAFFNRHRVDRFNPEAHGVARERALTFLREALQ
jgi:carboxymethylenebutenolidase